MALFKEFATTKRLTFVSFSEKLISADSELWENRGCNA